MRDLRRNRNVVRCGQCSPGHRNIPWHHASLDDHERNADWYILSLQKRSLVLLNIATISSVDDPRVLVVQGASRQFNPTLDEEMIATASQVDTGGRHCRLGGRVSTDISGYLDDDTIVFCRIGDRLRQTPHRPPRVRSILRWICKELQAADTPRIDAGHSAQGRHRKSHSTYADVIRGRYPPFDPELVAAEYASLCKAYNISSWSPEIVTEAEWVFFRFQQSRPHIQTVRA